MEMVLSSKDYRTLYHDSDDDLCEALRIVSRSSNPLFYVASIDKVICLCFQIRVCLRKHPEAALCPDTWNTIEADKLSKDLQCEIHLYVRYKSTK